MATIRSAQRRIDTNSVVLLLAGILCGVALMAGISLVHPLKRQAANPVIIVSSTGASDGVVGGRLGGINSSDTAVDAATRQQVAPGPASVATDRGPGTAAQVGATTSANFIVPGDVDGATLIDSAAPSANMIADDNLHAGLTRAGLSTAAGDSDLPRADEEVFYRGQWLEGQNTLVGGRLGGLESADTPNDAATKSQVSTSTQNIQRESDLAGQRDVNAAEQPGQIDFYPIFVPGHAW